MGRRHPHEDLKTTREILAYEGSALLDVVTGRNELSMPPKIEAEQVKGFSLYVLRAIMNGHGDGSVDLAKGQPPAVMLWRRRAEAYTALTKLRRINDGQMSW